MPEGLLFGSTKAHKELRQKLIENYESHKKHVVRHTCFTDELKNMSNTELINRFNKDVRNKGWASARASFLYSMHHELLSRGFDCSTIIDSNSMSMAHKIKLENNKLILID